MKAVRKAFTETLLSLARENKNIWALATDSRGSVTLRLLDPAKAAPILRAHGIAADGGCVTLPPLRDDLLAALVQQLAMNGAGVVELTPHTKTLEEIFLSLTANEEAD